MLASDIAPSPYGTNSQVLKKTN